MIFREVLGMSLSRRASACKKRQEDPSTARPINGLAADRRKDPPITIISPIIRPRTFILLRHVPISARALPATALDRLLSNQWPERSLVYTPASPDFRSAATSEVSDRTADVEMVAS